MLSRTAENLYWLGRYVERAESTARFIEMGRRMVMLPSGSDKDEWRSVILASGGSVPSDAPGPMTEHDAIRTLLLATDSPSSIRYCLARARHNGRAIRTALTQEMWESLNDGWRHLETLDEASASRDLPQVLEWVKRRSSAFRGASETGMLRNDGFDFLRLGGYIERADMKLRLLDVKYYVLLPETEVVGGGRDHHQWTSVLHASSAVRAYHHLYRGNYSPWNIADFLILNRDFPGSLSHCYGRIGEHLDRLARRYGAIHECHSLANKLIAQLDDLGMGAIFQRGLHEFIQESLTMNARLSDKIRLAYYF